LDEYLEEWLQAERELREKNNRSSDEGARRNEMASERRASEGKSHVLES
jgi:hypothetical protein